MSEGLKIIELRAENIKKLKAVCIKPDDNTVVISGRNGQGKQQPVSEPVLTPKGWKLIGQLCVGEHVIGSDGKATPITGVYPQTDRRTFVVTMSDGASTRCGPDHLWTVSSWRSAGKKTCCRVEETLTTEALMDRGLIVGSHRRWSIPLVGPVEFADLGEELPLDPYALGVILGDGHIEPTGYVTITSDAKIIERIGVIGWTYRDNTVLGSGFWSRPLKHLGLAGKNSFDKFIPDIYQFGRIEDRRALLTGLMDTDGTPEESWASYCTTSERLADDVVKLGSSLGFLCKKRKGQTKKYRRWSVAEQRPDLRRFIETIEQTEDEDSVCIRVANEDGLYVTKDFILTHNSSVLDAIWYTLGGSEASRGTVKPIREGESKAYVTLDLGDLVVTRKWTANDTSYLAVENKDGAVFKSPQAMLDKMIGNLSFDPLAFTNMSSRDQKDTLLSPIDLGFDLDEWETKRNKVYDDRTDNNRKTKDLKGAISNMPIPPEDTPDEEISISSIYQEVKRAKDITQQNNIKRRLLGEIQDRYRVLEKEVELLTKKLNDLKEESRETVKEYSEMKKTVEALIDPDVRLIEEKLSGAEEINRAVRAAKERKQAEAKLEAMQKVSFDLSVSIDLLDRQKTEALQKAKFPIDGLGFDEFGVTYDGIPFHQCSSAEQLRVSLAMGMALNPKIKILRVTDGSLLDSESLSQIRSLVKEKDYQIWIERVEEGPGAGIYIEDGEIVQSGGLK